jgi:hypothetical protein
MCWLQGILGAPVILNWTLTGLNTAGHTKRSTVLGIYFVYASLRRASILSISMLTTLESYRLYCAGNIAGPHLFLSSEAPRYPTAIKGLAGSYAGAMGLQIIYTSYCFFENRKKEKKGLLHESNSTEEAMEGFDDLTDKQNRHFRYRI